MYLLGAATSYIISPTLTPENISWLRPWWYMTQRMRKEAVLLVKNA